MSDTTHRDFWIEVLKALEPNLKRSDFLTWFQHTTVLNKEKNVVTVGFPVVLSRDWAANKYKKELLSAAQSVDPEIKEILYEVDGKLGQGDDARSIDVNKVSEPIKKVRKMPGKEEYMINTEFEAKL